MRTVSEILQRKGPQFNSIDAHRTVLEALNIMKIENHTYVIVFENGQYVGVFSENDYARKIILTDRSSNKTPVKEAMSADLPMVTGTDSPERCMHLMNLHKTRYLPVFDEFEFKGVITIQDLMRASLAGHEVALE